MPLQILGDGGEGVARGQGVDQIEEGGPSVPGNGADEEHGHGAQHVEEGVGQSRLLGHPVGVERPQLGGDGGADVGADEERHGGVEVHQLAGGQGEDHARKGGARLQQHGEDRPQKRGSQNGPRGHEDLSRGGSAVEEREEAADGVHFAQNLQFVGHHGHAEEEEPEAQQHGAPGVDRALFGQGHEKARRHAGQGKGAQVEGDELGGDGGADVGAENDPHGLDQRQETCVDEADDHDGGGGAGLDDGGDESPGQQGGDPVAGEARKDLPHIFPGGLPDPVAHHHHAQQEEGHAAHGADRHRQGRDGVKFGGDALKVDVVHRGNDIDVQLIDAGLFPGPDEGEGLSPFVGDGLGSEYSCGGLGSLHGPAEGEVNGHPGDPLAAFGDGDGHGFFGGVPGQILPAGPGDPDPGVEFDGLLALLESFGDDLDQMFSGVPGGFEDGLHDAPRVGNGGDFGDLHPGPRRTAEADLDAGDGQQGGTPREAAGPFPHEADLHRVGSAASGRDALARAGRDPDFGDLSGALLAAAGASQQKEPRENDEQKTHFVEIPCFEEGNVPSII